MTKTPKEIIDTLYEEIERKDRLITKLKEENSILMKTALKAEERAKEIENRIVKRN